MKIEFPYRMEYCHNADGTVTFKQKEGTGYREDSLYAFNINKDLMEKVFLYCDRSAKHGIPVYAIKQKFHYSPWQTELKHPIEEGRIYLKTTGNEKEIVFECNNKTETIKKSEYNFYIKCKAFRDTADAWFRYSFITKDKNAFLKDALGKKYSIGDYIYYATNQCYYFGDVISFTETINNEINGCVINVQKTDNKTLNNTLNTGQSAQYIICGMKSSTNYNAPSKKKTGTIISFDESEAVKRLLRC